MLTTGPAATGTGAATGTAAGAAAGAATTVGDWFRIAMHIAIIIIVLLLLLLLLLLPRLDSEDCSAVSCCVTWSLAVVPPMTVVRAVGLRSCIVAILSKMGDRLLCSARAAPVTESDQAVRDRRARDPVNPERRLASRRRRRMAPRAAGPRTRRRKRQGPEAITSGPGHRAMRAVSSALTCRAATASSA